MKDIDRRLTVVTNIARHRSKTNRFNNHWKELGACSVTHVSYLLVAGEHKVLRGLHGYEALQAVLGGVGECVRDVCRVVE